MPCYVSSKDPSHLEVIVQPVDCLRPTEAVVIEMHLNPPPSARHVCSEAEDCILPLEYNSQKFHLEDSFNL